MINARMKPYNYYTFGELNAYGQAKLTTEPVGTVKMALHLITQTNTNNPLYSQATYIALTNDAKVNDTYVIENEEGRKLKVLYVNREGRLAQVYLGNYGD